MENITATIPKSRVAPTTFITSTIPAAASTTTANTTSADIAKMELRGTYYGLIALFPVLFFLVWGAIWWFKDHKKQLASGLYEEQKALEGYDRFVEEKANFEAKKKDPEARKKAKSKKSKDDDFVITSDHQVWGAGWEDRYLQSRSKMSSISKESSARNSSGTLKQEGSG